ncbi:zinc knuckle CX2CX4HX4C containing protein [Tanacetum coccineum]|uniref:Zinc knuckle CX2CX4HX4C containing protein n=1 Tax=Tanacetum coccineum TaxID=301880 RepID=A0ABQ4WHN9_9ASTR
MFDMNNKCSVGKSNVVMFFRVSKLLWHNKLDHPADQVLSILKNDLSISKYTSVPMCEVCHRAKQTREPFPLSDYKSKTLGIVHQTSCAHTPQRNGIAERKHRHLLNVARSLMFQGGIPLRFWSNSCVSYKQAAIIYVKWSENSNNPSLTQLGDSLDDVQTPGLRRSTRQSKLPMKLNDYVLSSSVKYRIEKKPIGSKWIWKIKYRPLMRLKDIKLDLWLKGLVKGFMFVALLVYVDDIVITGNDEVEIKPDISYVVHCLSQHMHSPLQSHFKAALRVLRYLKGSPSLGLQFNKCSELRLRAYADANWAKCLKIRKSVTGYCVFLGNSIISWKSEGVVNDKLRKSQGKQLVVTSACGGIWHDLQEAVLEGGPWFIRKSSIILKKWSMDTRLLKDELTRIPIWVKLHDVPIQVFEEDGISLIATFIGKPVMLDSYTSSMCIESWGRSSFARCLIEVNSEVDLVDVVTIGILSLSEDGFTKETIRVEYEWRPPRCDICKIFGHVHDYCPKKVVSSHIATTSNVVTPIVEKTNDGFQTVGKKKKRKCKSKSTNGGQFTGPSVKQNVRYEPKATTTAPKKGATYVGNTPQSSSMLKTTGNSSKKYNLSMSNSFSALNDEEEDDEEDVKNVHDESVNLILNTKAGGSSSFTAAVG